MSESDIQFQVTRKTQELSKARMQTPRSCLRTGERKQILLGALGNETKDANRLIKCQPVYSPCSGYPQLSQFQNLSFCERCLEYSSRSCSLDSILNCLLHVISSQRLGHVRLSRSKTDVRPIIIQEKRLTWLE